MTQEPRRWLDEPPEDPLLSEWLREGEQDLPDSAVLARAATALGIASAAALPAAAAAALPAAAAKVAAVTSTPAAAALPTAAPFALTTFKIFLAVTVAGVVSVSSYLTIPHAPEAQRNETPTPSVSGQRHLAKRAQEHAVTPPPFAANVDRGPRPTASSAPAPDLELEQAPADVRAPAPRAERQAPIAKEPLAARTISPKPTTAPEAINEGAPTSLPSSATNLIDREELALLQKARANLDTDPRAALALLNEHERRYTHSWLDEERDAMHIRAFLGNGDSQTARQRLTQFLKDHPHSPQRQGLQSRLEAK